MNKTVLITGAAGFIGANYAYRQAEKYPNRRLVLLDALTYAGNVASIESLLDQERVSFEHVDIQDRDAVFSVYRNHRPEIVVNFAAESHVDRSVKDPGIFLRTNILGTQNLMDAALEFGVQRYHQVSTDEVYGDLPLDRPDLFFTEKTPIQTSSPYSASKASADLLVQAYERTFGLPISISRCSNNYGPYQFPEKLIPLMILRANKNESLPVYGQGINVRDWLWVTDHCDAIDAIIEQGSDGSVYNIGGHNEWTNIDVVKLLLDTMEKPHSLIRFVTDRPGHDQRYAIDNTKIISDLGWEPSLRFEEGIVKTIDWYLANEDWWIPILDGSYENYFERMYEAKELS